MAGAVVVKQIPFSSSRPGLADRVTTAVESHQDVEARLWQDPFGAADQHRRDVKVYPPGHRSAGAPQDAHHELAAFLASIPHARRITVMPVLVPGGPYTEDAEQRRRARYAVLAAIHVSGRNMMSLDDRHIGYLDFDRSGLPRMLPYEWLVSTKPDGDVVDRGDAILLLWVDETRLPEEQPLESLLFLLEQLSLCQLNRVPERTAELKIIGPQSTPVLKSMQVELDRNRVAVARRQRREPSCFDTLDMYTLATGADFRESNGNIVYRSSGHPAGKLAALRVIGRDQELVPHLIRELQLRGVRPGDDEVVLISELDSRYARDLADTMQQHLCRPPLVCSARIHRFGYFRGLDGVFPRSSDGPKGGASTKGEQEDRNRKATERDQLERAEGDSQFDYLRRLAAEIREDTGGVYTGERRVKAIGIFGRDVYDKLLILQALRDEYPRTIFFTTDLDVRLLHPQDFRYARNLIVASGFAPRLDRSRHGGIPPFRDNYQTAEFLAVQLALEGQGWTRRLAHKRCWIGRCRLDSSRSGGRRRLT